eukprot:g5211.t1
MAVTRSQLELGAAGVAALLVLALSSFLTDSTYYLSSFAPAGANATAAYYGLLTTMWLLQHSAAMERKVIIYIAVGASLFVSYEALRKNVNCTIATAAIIFFAAQMPAMPRDCKRYTAALAALAYFGKGGDAVQKEGLLLLVTAICAAFTLLRLVDLAKTFRATVPASYVVRIVSHILPSYSYTRKEFFRADMPPEDVAQKREASFDALCTQWKKLCPKQVAVAEELRGSFSDLRFAASNRVFLPFGKFLSSSIEPCTVVETADRMHLTDIDGNTMIDVSGSYGVNVVGYDQYKKFLCDGLNEVKDLGCVLGSLHPLTVENIKMLKAMSGQEEVSMHMSGTEAVMAAVRVARFSTGRKLIVLFGGAYHGWWDGVQATLGNERVPGDVLTVHDLSPASLAMLEARASEIAAVLINPLQSFHPNSPPPSDLSLASNTRHTMEGSDHYKTWLQKLRKVCTNNGIALVFDEVYTGFRLAPRGAQEYFGCEADMVVYGKTLGGGMPVGVVCGPSRLMRRTDPTKPMRVSYVIGTFSAHPLTMGSMNQFLKWVTSKAAAKQYTDMERKVVLWCVETNKLFEKEDVPLRVASYSTVWTMIYQMPGRYHWLLQYFLRAEGVALSWVGTGRLNFSLDFNDADLKELQGRMLKACNRMKEGGWWWQDEKRPGYVLKLKLVREIVGALVSSLNPFAKAVKADKKA